MGGEREMMYGEIYRCIDMDGWTDRQMDEKRRIDGWMDV